jgi:hypothetical protein
MTSTASITSLVDCFVANISHTWFRPKRHHIYLLHKLALEKQVSPVFIETLADHTLGINIHSASFQVHRDGVIVIAQPSIKALFSSLPKNFSLITSILLIHA